MSRTRLKLIGNIFNYKYSYVSDKFFKVISDIGKAKNGCRIFCCKCIYCGRKFEAISSNIKIGTVKVCSCISKDNLKNTSFKNCRAINSIGRTQDGHRLWLCICKLCGIYFVAGSNDLKKDENKSCGCLRRENLRNIAKNNKGKNNPNYNHDLTDEERENGRNINGYDEWRESVYERDNFTCQCCGDSKGGNLVVHHKENYSDNEYLRIEIDNGITLCEKCHILFHKLYGRKHTNTFQTEEFIKGYKNALVY